MPDPSRRLEDVSPAVLAWQQRLHEQATATLAALPGGERFERAVHDHMAASRVALPALGGGRCFQLEPNARGSFAAVRVGDDVLEAGALVAAAGAGPLAGELAIEWAAPSPDGRLLALGTTSDGDEQVTLTLVAVASGERVGPPIRHVMTGSVGWLPDASALYCARGRGWESELPLKRLARVEPGGPAVEVDAPATAADARAVVRVSGDGRYVTLATGITQPCVLGIHDRASGAWLDGLDADADAEAAEIFFGVCRGGEYVAVTTHGAARGRLVAAPLDALAERERWRELIPEGRSVLRGVAEIGEDLLLLELDDGVARLRRVGPDGSPRAVLRLPDGLVLTAPDLAPPVAVLGDDVLLVVSGVDRSHALWRWSTASGEAHALTEPRVRLPGVRARVARLTRTRGAAADEPGGGTAYVTVERDDLPPGPRPTLLHGYGGFNVAAFPTAYPAVVAPWIEAGGRYVYAHLPGDGTFGRDQWRGGRRAVKQRTFDALFRVAEQLVAERLTTPEQLALLGVSNGGLLAGAALTQRPELFAAVAALVPLCDMLRYRRDRYAETLGAEYGDPSVPDEARWLAGYSPCDRVPRDRPLPAAIVASAERDVRIPPWHARKLVAALLDAGAPSQSVLLRVHRACGHVDSSYAQPRQIAEWLGFLMAHTGLPVDA